MEFTETELLDLLGKRCFVVTKNIAYGNDIDEIHYGTIEYWRYSGSEFEFYVAGMTPRGDMDDWYSVELIAFNLEDALELLNKLRNE